MSYRNDHDAAIARVDALELELARLQREREQAERIRPILAQIPQANRRWRVFVAALCLGCAVGIAWNVPSAKHRRPVAPEPLPLLPAAMPLVGSEILRHCLDRVLATASDETQLDARTTDPHAASPIPVERIVAIGAGCRRELRDAVVRGVDVADWSRTEDALAGAISRIVVYYGSDPYRLDGYATAPQLWRELVAARSERDSAARGVSLPISR